MKKFAFIVSGAALGGLMMMASPAFAETVEEMCLRVSEEWGSTGDVPAQCSCLGQEAAANADIEKEIWAISETASNDSEAYDQSSDALKAILDKCAVEH